MAVTMKDIAAKANVSATVVCAVLGGRTTCHVSEEKRRLILDLVKQCGYQPNAQARGLRLGKSHTIGILMADFRDRVMAELSMGLYREFLAAGYASSMAVWENLKEIEQAYANCIRGNVDGIVTCDWHPEWLTEKKPAVVYGCHAPDADSLVMDYETGLRQAMAYLKKLGHRRIAYIGPASARRTAFLKAAGEAGMEISWSADSVRGNAEGGAEGMRALLSAGNSATAVFCHNDTVAFGVMAEAQQAGLTIGKDISVVGLDNIPEAGLSFPPLTTVNTFVGDKAGVMARMMLERLRHPEMELRHIDMKTELFIRKSCGPAKTMKSDSKHKKTTNVKRK